jgi:citrate lyase subunit beta/citryl-CoA lyase
VWSCLTQARPSILSATPGRLNTIWCHDDVIDIVTSAGENFDVIIVPKARRARDVWCFDVLLSQLEAALGVRRPIGLEVLIEEAEGLENAVEIATASPRPAAIILGAGDRSASTHARADTNFAPIHLRVQAVNATPRLVLGMVS